MNKGTKRFFVFGTNNGGCDFHGFIKADTLEITPNARIDFDSYRDATGVLHRNAQSHTATVIEFDTIPMFSVQFSALINNLKSQYINYNERDAQCSYFDPETNQTKTGHFYLDSNWKVSVYASWKISDQDMILYNPVHFKFVEY